MAFHNSRFFLVAVACFWLVACSTEESWILDPGKAPDTETLDVDIVVIKTYAALVAFAPLSASDWFDNEERLKMQWSGQIDVLSFTLEPGERGNISTLAKDKAKTVLIFRHIPDHGSENATRREAASL